jgi:ELWxxDGT repeat protein
MHSTTRSPATHRHPTTLLPRLVSALAVLVLLAGTSGLFAGSVGAATALSVVRLQNFSSISPAELRNVNGTLFFAADDGTNGQELWKSDDTTAGTTLVKDINPGSFGPGPSELTNVNGTLFFQADEGTGGTQLWKLTTGTAVYLPLTVR